VRRTLRAAAYSVCGPHYPSTSMEPRNACPIAE
jgi:hypothetical protein